MIHKDKIVKNITAFGGLQLLSLTIGVVRSKFAAILLEAQGVGFLGLLVSAINLVSGILNLGLPTSAIKTLSGMSGKDFAKNVKVYQGLSFGVGLLGGVICFIFAKNISIFLFHKMDYEWGVRLLSVSLLLKQLATILSSIIQSTSNLKNLANANIISNVIGVLFTVPIYYYFRINGIFYNLVIVGIVEFIVFYFYFKKKKIEKEKINIDDFIISAKKIVGESFFFNLSSNLTLLSNYLLQLFITYYEGMKVLGYYFSGYTILNTYVSVIFTAMSVDYFPRISRNREDIDIVNKEVNFQIFIGTVILLPILLNILLFSDFVIRLLFSKDFVAAVGYLKIAILSVFFKLFSWALGYVILAKGTKKMILNNAIQFNLLFIIIHFIGFYTKGLIGVAIASNFYFLLHLLYNYWLVHKYLEVKIENKTKKVYFYCALILFFSIIINFADINITVKSFIIAIVMVLSGLWSLKQMNLIFKWIK